MVVYVCMCVNVGKRQKTECVMLGVCEKSIFHAECRLSTFVGTKTKAHVVISMNARLFVVGRERPPHTNTHTHAYHTLIASQR